MIEYIKYIEYIKDKLITIFNWIKSKLKLDKNKLHIDDVIEVYDMVKDFISGGTDGIIDATDAILLVKRLQELIKSNSIESDAS